MPRQFGVPEDLIADVVSGAKLPSAYAPYLSPIHDRHVIGVNNAYQLGTWIDALFFGDCGWYLVHRFPLAKWPNLKVTCCKRFEKKNKQGREGIKYLAKDTSHRWGISPHPTRVSWNSNSGSSAINLAAHFGARRIILLGFDMSVDGSTHWHRGHGNKAGPPFARHLKGFPQIAADAKERGIEILNASPVSAIQHFQVVSLKEAIDG